MELAFIFALLVGAAGLVVLDLVLLARREWRRWRELRAFRAAIARDRAIHDRVVAEAQDYLELMSIREKQLATMDLAHIHRTSPTQATTSRGIEKARPQLARSL